MRENTWKIRPLEWVDANGDSQRWHWRAITPFAVMDLYRTLDGGYWWCCAMRSSDTKMYDTPEAAKAAAELWYRTRLEPALEKVQ